MSKLEKSKFGPTQPEATSAGSLSESVSTYSGSTLNAATDDSSLVHQNLTLTILYHPDHARVGERAILDTTLPTQLSRHDTLFSSTEDGSKRSLKDPFVSRSALSLSPGLEHSVRLFSNDPKLRVLIDGKLFAVEALVVADELCSGVVITLGDRVVLLLHRTSDEPDTVQSYGLVGCSSRIREIRTSIEKAAASDVPVLLRGETGTGKELVARAIAESNQRAKPYVTVNMSAVTPEMASAEFFGVQRNSATGVDAREGYFAAARGGTLFLDEVGLAHVQVLNALLRALDGGEIQRIGAKGSDRLRAQVRLISATDTNLERAINQGTFSQAVLQRLGGYPILLPALRERREDVGLLLVHFLKLELEKQGKLHLLKYEPTKLGWLRAPLVARIAQYAFPGNVRELRNLAQALAIHSHTLPEARLPDEWERCLQQGPARASNGAGSSVEVAADERSQFQGTAPRGPSTLPPSGMDRVHGESRSQPPQTGAARSVTDDEFRAIAHECRYSKSAMAKKLDWDRRAVDTRWNGLGMRSVKEISDAEFADAVRKVGLDRDRLAEIIGVSRKSLLDRFGGNGPKGGR